MIDRLRQVLTPRAMQIGLLVVLAVSAVFLADAEGGQQIADDAFVQRAAESVLSASAVMQSSAREAVLIRRAFEEGISSGEELNRATTALEERADELDTRTDTLTDLIESEERLRRTSQQVLLQAAAIVDAIDSGNTGAAIEANEELIAATDELTDQATQIRNQRQAHIDATRRGIATVATAARFMAGLGIPALALLFLYRGLRVRQKQVLLRTELEQEKALRKKKDQFLAGASHHLNTPLSAVVGFTELLRDKSRTFNAAVRNEMIEMLANQAQETSRVAEDLLIAARSDMGELTLDNSAADLRRVVEEVTETWTSTERARLHISGGASVNADQKRLPQIVRNLLRNAISHGGDNVEVTIVEGLNRVVLEVADNGEGVPEGQEEMIFQPYYSFHQIDGVPPAMGLGLSVARRLARAMGGDLKYGREDDRSIFRLTLPKAHDSAAKADPSDTVIDPSAGKPAPADIKGVLADGGPQIVYQPIIDMAARDRGEESIIGYESLSRFPFASPPDWFKAARSAGIGIDLELASIRAAVQHFESEQEERFLAVNVSDETLTSSRLLDATEGLEPSRLVFELSETAVIPNYKNTKERIEALKRRGIRLAIDDVGAEEIDLWHIIRLGASVIKIDMSLVREVSESPSIRGLIRAIVSMADEIGALVISEGVETETEHNHLSQLGVQFGQGYLYGKPEPLRWAERVLSP